MSGPAAGYEFDEKRRYRERVWSALERGLSRVPVEDRVVALLDSSDAFEALFLLDRGYSARNICVVNREPAVTSWVTRNVLKHRKKRVRTYGMQLSRALREMRREGLTPHAINMDFTGNIGLPMDEELTEIRDGLVDRVQIGVTVLRGREKELLDVGVHSMVRRGVPPDDAADFARARYVLLVLGGAIGNTAALCAWHLKLTEVDSYLSTSGQTMLWLTADVRSHGRGCLEAGHRSWMERVGRARKNSVDSLSAPTCLVVGGMANALNGGGLALQKWIAKLSEAAEAEPDKAAFFGGSALTQMGQCVDQIVDARYEGDSRLARWHQRESARYQERSDNVDSLWLKERERQQQDGLG